MFHGACVIIVSNFWCNWLQEICTLTIIGPFFKVCYFPTHTNTHRIFFSSTKHKLVRKEHFNASKVRLLGLFVLVISIMLCSRVNRNSACFEIFWNIFVIGFEGTTMIWTDMAVASQSVDLDSKGVKMCCFLKIILKYTSLLLMSVFLWWRFTDISGVFFFFNIQTY